MSRIDLNTCSIQELTTIPGIDNKIADNIIRYRHGNKKITNFDEIWKVNGIDRSRFQLISKHCKLSASPIKQIHLYSKSADATNSRRDYINTIARLPLTKSMMDMLSKGKHLNFDLNSPENKLKKCLPTSMLNFLENQNLLNFTEKSLSNSCFNNKKINNIEKSHNLSKITDMNETEPNITYKELSPKTKRSTVGLNSFERDLTRLKAKPVEQRKFCFKTPSPNYFPPNHSQENVSENPQVRLTSPRATTAKNHSKEKESFIVKNNKFRGVDYSNVRTCIHSKLDKDSLTQHKPDTLKISDICSYEVNEDHLVNSLKSQQIQNELNFFNIKENNFSIQNNNYSSGTQSPKLVEFTCQNVRDFDRSRPLSLTKRNLIIEEWIKKVNKERNIVPKPEKAAISSQISNDPEEKSIPLTKHHKKNTETLIFETFNKKTNYLQPMSNKSNNFFGSKTKDTEEPKKINSPTKLLKDRDTTNNRFESSHFLQRKPLLTKDITLKSKNKGVNSKIYDCPLKTVYK